MGILLFSYFCMCLLMTGHVADLVPINKLLHRFLWHGPVGCYGHKVGWSSKMENIQQLPAQAGVKTISKSTVVNA